MFLLRDRENRWVTREELDVNFEYLHRDIQEWNRFTLALQEDLMRLMDYMEVEFKDIPDSRIVTKKEPKE